MKTKIRKELFKNEDHRSIVSSSKSKSNSSKSTSTKGQEICDMCGEVRKLYVVNIDKDYKEHWCEKCIKEEENISKKNNGKRNQRIDKLAR